MKTISRSGMGVALLALVAACGAESTSADNQVLLNERTAVDNGLIVDPEIPNVGVGENGAAPLPASEAAGVTEPAAVKTAPAPPKPAPKAETPRPAPKPKAPPPATDPHAGHDMNQM